ncbi:MAG: hypothetical protein IKP67_07820 [Spirochaetales bacterium]|nr:hypothetical protein [Spirochaetales bacterium]
MKRIFIFGLAAIIAVSIACCTTESETTPTTSVANDTLKTEVYFNNLSDYEVNVYFNVTPYSKDKKSIANVKKRSNVTIDSRPSFNNISDVFYFEYMIPVGDVTFPAFQNKDNIGYKTVLIEENKTNKINIEKITECTTESAFFLIENKSGVSIQLKKGMFFREPVGSSENNIINGKSAVYELNNSIESDFTFSGLDIVKIVINATKELPLPINSVEKGMIYTMVVTADDVKLKSITPFNIDIQKQIWTKSIGSQYNVQCVRQNSDKDGVVVISTGTSQPNVIQCDMYDKYGNVSSSGTMQYGSDCTNDVYDCIEDGYGSVVMLLQSQTADGAAAHLVSYDFDSKVLSFDYKFNTEYVWVFRKNMQNSIAVIDDDVYAVVGGVVDDEGAMSSFIMKIDTAGSEIVVTPAYSDVTTDVSDGVQTMFTSVYYDKTDFYACGYENCDFAYNDRIHNGVIYKISSDLQTWDKVYTKDNTLLFGIVGKDNHYWACGEYADTGKILKGCLVCDSTDDVQVFTAEQAYHWFNQIAVSGDKLLLCGPTSQNMDGSGTAYSVVTAVNMSSGKTEWSNTFTDYADALSCIPNGIGSYIVQLKGENGTTTIKSADLLGR